MKNISLDILRAFVVFADSENITKAAEKLNISQPSLSVQLAKLEEALPFSPFSMSGKKKLLNPYGQALYKSLNLKIYDLQKQVETVTLLFSDA